MAKHNLYENIKTKKDAIAYLKSIYLRWPLFFKRHAPMQRSLEIIFEDDRKKVKSCINLNDRIKVKLNDFGREIYYHQFDAVNELGLNLEPTYPETDENGYSTFQLWWFISLYGDYLSYTNITKSFDFPLEDLNIYIVKEDEEI